MLATQPMIFNSTKDLLPYRSQGEWKDEDPERDPNELCKFVVHRKQTFKGTEDMRWDLKLTYKLHGEEKEEKKTLTEGEIRAMIQSNKLEVWPELAERRKNQPRQRLDKQNRAVKKRKDFEEEIHRPTKKKRGKGEVKGTCALKHLCFHHTETSKRFPISAYFCGHSICYKRAQHVHKNSPPGLFLHFDPFNPDRCCFTVYHQKHQKQMRQDEIGHRFLPSPMPRILPPHSHTTSHSSLSPGHHSSSPSPSAQSISLPPQPPQPPPLGGY